MAASSRASSKRASSKDSRFSTERSQVHPSVHSKNQFEGLFRGLGVCSREPVCNRRNTETRKHHFDTHFAIGSMKWDEGNRDGTTAHDAFVDPQVTFATRDAPYKNASIVELRQTQYDGTIHFRTEQRERYASTGVRARQPMCDPGTSQVHLGDDRPELVTQTTATHFRPEKEEVELGRSLRHAGVGTLIPTTSWPKPARCNPVTGGGRYLDAHDLGVDDMSWKMPTANHSAIVYDVEAVRDPILGHSVPTEALHVPGSKTTRAIVDEFNTNVPALRSLGTLRPTVDV